MNATIAKELLDPIPAKDFITNSFSDNNGKCCGIGHLIRLTSKNPDNYSPNNCSDRTYKYGTGGVRIFVRDKVDRFMKKEHNINLYGDGLSEINNRDCHNGYTQKKVKARIIHLLKDMIKAGY